MSEVLDGKFADAASATRYIKGGNATITLRSEKTGTRFTYKIELSEDGKVHFVKVLVGADNHNSYSYLGMLARDGSFRRTAKSRIEESAVSHIAFDWSWKKLAAGTLPTQLEVWHEGRCGRCGRKLTVPESVSSGFGPECIKKAGG